MRKLSDNWIGTDEPDINQRLDNRPDRVRFVYQKDDPKKKLHVAKMIGGRTREGLIHEIEVTKSLDHPNIIKIVDCETEIEEPWFVTEYTGGPTFRSTGYTKWSMNERMNCLYQIVDALQHMNNKGYVRRLESHSIFMQADGKTPILGDFETTSGMSPTGLSEQVKSVSNLLAQMLISTQSTDAQLSLQSLDHQIQELNKNREKIKRQIEKEAD